jgi:D-xylose transport system permease protein
MPSFVTTLAGLLAILGMQLYVMGPSGSINLPYGSAVVDFGQMMVLPTAVSLLLALLPGAVMLVSGLRTRRRRSAARLSAPSLGGLLARSASLTLLLVLVVAYLSQGRGVPLMFGVFLGLAVLMHHALTRTQWGRSMFAVGGNPEAARRAGIPVRRVYVSAFMLCASLAALGGVLGAARLASASQQAGTGDVNLNAIAAAVIGGTSLFGGRGSAWSAVLGIIVIQSIASGLTLLNLSSSLRFMITGAVLAIAVIVDSLARQSRVSHGRA